VNDLVVKNPDFVKSLYDKLWEWEQELARLLWFLQTKFDKIIVDLGERFHKTEKK